MIIVATTAVREVAGRALLTLLNRREISAAGAYRVRAADDGKTTASNSSAALSS